MIYFYRTIQKTTFLTATIRYLKTSLASASNEGTRDTTVAVTHIDSEWLSDVDRVGRRFENVWHVRRSAKTLLRRARAKTHVGCVRVKRTRAVFFLLQRLHDILST